MFEKMSCTVCLLCFSSRSCIDPYSNGRGLRPWRVLGCDLYSLAFALSSPLDRSRTVKPFDKVVDSVRAGVTGLAYLRNGATELRALLTREACRKLYASLCDAIVRIRGKVKVVVAAIVLFRSLHCCTQSSSRSRDAASLAYVYFRQLRRALLPSSFIRRLLIGYLSSDDEMYDGLVLVFTTTMVNCQSL